MFPQFLSMEYGSQRRLEQKLDEHLGNGNHEVVQVGAIHHEKLTCHSLTAVAFGRSVEGHGQRRVG